MDSSHRDTLNALSDEELLDLLSFHRREYTEATVAEAESIASNRLYTSADIVEFRRENLPGSQADYDCGTCGATLVLNVADLSEGRFCCPVCKASQEIDYSKPRYAESANSGPTSNLKVVPQRSIGDGNVTSIGSPKGLGGWLTLVGIGLVLGLIGQFVYMMSAIYAGNTAEAISQLVGLSIFALLLHMYWYERKAFPTFFIVLMWLGAILTLMVLDDSDPQAGAVRSPVSASVVAIVWTLYFLMSRRVKATFTKPWRDKSKAQGTQSGLSADIQAGTRDSRDVAAEAQPDASAPPSEGTTKLSMAATVPVVCTSCKCVLEHDYEYCPKCGAAITTFLCGNCGTAVEKSHTFCTKCGSRILSAGE